VISPGSDEERRDQPKIDGIRWGLPWLRRAQLMIVGISRGLPWSCRDQVRIGGISWRSLCSLCSCRDCGDPARMNFFASVDVQDQKWTASPHLRIIIARATTLVL